ncbi:MAG: hypothetical protein ACRELG_02425, partial [Gemmataceae bacterium]
ATDREFLLHGCSLSRKGGFRSPIIRSDPLDGRNFITKTRNNENTKKSTSEPMAFPGFPSAFVISFFRVFVIPPSLRTRNAFPVEAFVSSLPRPHWGNKANFPMPTCSWEFGSIRIGRVDIWGILQSLIISEVNRRIRSTPARTVRTVPREELHVQVVF